MARILAEPGFQVLGQAGDVAELVELVRADPPDVAIIDISMPPGHAAEGIEAAAEIRRSIAPGVGLLLMSQHVDTKHAMQLVGDFDGGVGYLLKDRVSDLATFAQDIRRVAAGDCVIDAELVARLVAMQRAGDPLADLSPRELHVLALMARGRSNSALSDELHLSPKTVEAHVRSIFTKLTSRPRPPTTGGCSQSSPSSAPDAHREPVLVVVAVAFEGEDLGVVDEAVDHRGGGDFVAEDLAPSAEGLLLVTITTRFVAARDEHEHEAGGLRVERDVADLVDLCGYPHSLTYADTATMPTRASRAWWALRCGGVSWPRRRLRCRH